MGDWDQARSIDAFLIDLHQNRGIGEQHLPRYRELVEAFLASRRGLPLDDLNRDDVEAYLAECKVAGLGIKPLKAAQTASAAFVHFVIGGGLVAAEPILPQARPQTPSEPGSMVEDMKRALSPDALATAAAISATLILGVFGLMATLLGWILYWASVAGAFFYVLDHVAKGQKGLPLGAAENLGRHLWRGLMIGLVGALPVFIAMLQLAGKGTSEGLGRGLVLLVAALIGAAIVPAATVGVYASQSALAALAPHLWFRIIARIPNDYGSLVGLCVAAVVVQAVWGMLIGLVLGSFPLLASFAYAPVVVLLAIAVAAGFGGVLDRRRDDLGL